MFSGQVPPLDIHILFDQSGSMALKDDGVTRRIEAVRGALNQFFQAPESKGIGVGLAFFGYHPLSCACTSCNPADYTKPVVAVAELPNHASTLTAALATIEPTGETPTGAALRGACAYARSAMSTRTDRQLTVLLVTDGEPQAPLTAAKGTCMPTIGDAIDASAECEKGSPSVRVFVLGVGPSLQNLNYIAAAGGTANAYLVEGGGGRDILNALNQIRRDAQIPCTLDIPKPNHAALDFNKVNVIYGDSKCNLTTLVRVDSAAACFGVKDGWYYDHPDHPTRVRLCESTCKMVSQPMGQLRIAMGCQTIIIP
jgi:hypothetical protein